MPALSALQATPPTPAAPDRAPDRTGVRRDDTPSFATLLRKGTRQADAGGGKDVPAPRRSHVAGPGREVPPQPADEKIEGDEPSDPKSDPRPDTAVPVDVVVAPVAPTVLPVVSPVVPATASPPPVGVPASIAAAPIVAIPIDGTIAPTIAPDYSGSASAFLAQPEDERESLVITGPTRDALPRPDPAIDPHTLRPARFENPAAFAASGRRARDPVAVALEVAKAPTDATRTDPAAAALVAAPTTVQPTGDTARGSLDLAQHDWPQAMIDRIERLRDAADAADTSIRIVPDALGTIDVSVRRQGEVTHVHFAAEQAQTRALLAEAQPRLVELGEARGLRFGQSSVDAGTAQQQPAPQRRRPAPHAPSAAMRARGAGASTDHRIA